MNIECPQCQTPLEIDDPPPVTAPPMLAPRPVRAGGFTRFAGICILAVGTLLGFVALFMGTANGSTHNIGLISERSTVATASLGLIVLGLGLHIIGQLDLANAHFARMNERR